MKITKRSSRITIDLAKTVRPATLAKLYYLCKKRKLRFPEGVVFLLEEVSEPERGGDCRKAKRADRSLASKVSSRQGKVR